MPRPSAVNPTFPVWNKDEKAALATGKVPFEIVRVGSFRSPKYGATWRLTCRNLVTNASGIMLFAANDVRDDAFGAIKSALEADGEPVGPCILGQTAVNNDRTTWEILDAPD